MFESKLPFSVNTCSITSSPEKFVCINIECSEIKDQSFGCYECLIKKHKQIDQLHFEKIIEIPAFLSQIKQKSKQKNDILDKLIIDCDSKKKLVLQQIHELENFVNIDLLHQRLLQLFSTYLAKLQNEKDLIILAPDYSNQQHLKLLKFYHEDIEQYGKVITQSGIELQGEVDEILENYQIVSLQKFNKLKNQIEALKIQFNEQNQKFAQWEIQRERERQRESPFMQIVEQLKLPVIFVLSILLFLVIGHNLFYLNAQDFDSRLVLNQTQQEDLNINYTNQEYQTNYTKYTNQTSQANQTNQTSQTNQTNQDKQSKSQNTRNQQWLISEILENRRVEEFQNFTIIYDQSFNKTFTQDTYERIQKRVFWDKNDKLVCIGARENKNLRLIGCDLASEVFSITQDAYSARKSQNGEMYWYWVQSKSFGFSPNKNIALTNIDNEDLSSELRFSFGTSKNLEERRVGSQYGHKNTSQYNLVIYASKDNN
ncbi:unnamed protein product (macronuclear) [Paramecium tetraurelia]|uniref:Uncharacterized protein n=1 Tax=Paramecium tetraurelia TaxID=5888 RepID=A0E3Y8_PARTE|nr:uncharacterized protein GSPATT00023178001 [Paramecium tetraurelia]CAK90005.1 unnamed protein product [Paramecium tetraurelia]|eukprot:XP_001457402.1 hypothetical protein (macronuclear) [Paramecium tetraurelia strain d4-2]